MNRFSHTYVVLTHLSCRSREHPNIMVSYAVHLVCPLRGESNNLLLGASNYPSQSNRNHPVRANLY